MANITIWNKGRRTWKVKDADGKNVELAPQESVNMDEVAGLKLVAAYPRDLTTSGIAAPSFDDIKRREQSVNDREAHLDKREKELDERSFIISDKSTITGKGAPEEIEFWFEVGKEKFTFKGSRAKMQEFSEVLATFLEEKPSADDTEPAKKRGRPAKAE